MRAVSACHRCWHLLWLLAAAGASALSAPVPTAVPLPSVNIPAETLFTATLAGADYRFPAADSAATPAPAIPALQLIASPRIAAPGLSAPQAPLVRVPYALAGPDFTPAAAPAARRPAQTAQARPAARPPVRAPRAVFNGPVRIAIIIDDIGYNRDLSLRAAQLPAAVTLAVLPHSPNGAEIAGIGHRSGKEIMLHAPMAAESGRALGKGALTAAMGQQAFIKTLREAIAAVPHVTGVNNHMGSQLTQNSRAMGWLMGELKSRQLYFVDSRTSAASVALDTARASQLPSLKRDVFLDNERSVYRINRQLEQLLMLAREQGQAVAIGHPYPETLQALEARLPQLRAEGIQLVPVSQLLGPAGLQISTSASINAHPTATPAPQPATAVPVY
jgi:polysaccharide deacetylase 2 family uncharacterized protein YibQ